MLTAADLLDALGIPGASGSDAAWAQRAVDAVNVFVDGLPHVTPGAWDDRTTAGALLLATEVYQARSAPAGAPGLDITGGFVAGQMSGRVGQLLRIGRTYGAPRAG